MPAKPAADIPVTAELAAALISEQYPALAGEPVTEFAAGWDNVIYRVGAGFVARLPRREVAAHLVANEQRFLPLYAAHTAVPLPVPVHNGRPGPGFPWPWSITAWLDGVPAARVSPAERECARSLARFVTDIHRPAGPEAPANPVRGVPLASRDAAVRSRLETGLDVPRERELEALWTKLCGVPGWDGPALWLHGDLHPANILLRDGRLAAVLDFGDLTAGDPATDLATAWLTFDAAGRRTFRQSVEAAGPVDEDTWLRARGWALCMASALAAHSADEPVLRAIGVHALSEVLADD